MNFYRKIHLSIFLTSLVVGGVLLSASLVLVQRDMTEQFLERYSNLADVIANSLLETEASVEKVGLNAAKHLRTIVQSRGIPSEAELKALAIDLNVNQLTIANQNGRFIRDTVTPPSDQSKGLFEFCDDYRKLISGESLVEATPILPSFPYKGPSKFIMIPSHDRKYILETGMHLEGIGQVLAKTIRTDENIRSISLLSPTGFNYGTIFSDGKFIDGEQQQVDDLATGVVSLTGESVVVVKRVSVSSKQCCECKMKKVSGDQGYYYLLKVVTSTAPLRKVLGQAQLGALLLSLVLLIFSAVVSRLLAQRLVYRIRLVDSAIRVIEESGSLETKINVEGSDEISSLARSFNQMIESLRGARIRQVELEKATALGEQASQVAHDIRSPLVALNFIVGTMNELPDSKRSIIRDATQRISDIANDLLSRNRKREATPTETPLLISLLDGLVSEKRIRYRERDNVEIRPELQGGYGLFVKMDSVKISRVISNLIDNSMEAIQGPGKVVVRLRAEGEKAILEVIDNGPGIPKEIMDRIGEKGFSHGKQAGNGLGIYHARKTVSEAGGTFEIESSSSGSLFRLILPSTPPPKWFPTKIVLSSGMSLISLDDEQTVHRAWDMRLQEGKSDIPHIVFTSGEEFLKWISESRPPSALYLIDYEFSKQSRNGLELIRSANIAKSSVLVTSHFEDKEVQQRASELGVQILPKGLVSFIPIQIS